jgi:hypothetical protein
VVVLPWQLLLIGSTIEATTASVSMVVVAVAAGAGQRRHALPVAREIAGHDVAVGLGHSTAPRIAVGRLVAVAVRIDAAAAAAISMAPRICFLPAPKGY